MTITLRSVIFTIVVCFLSIQSTTHATYSFNEELFVETLPDHHLNFHFQFTSTYDLSTSKHDISTDYGFFPKTIGDIVNAFGINRFRLTLTQGSWKYNDWGLPASSAPSGAELYAFFDPILGSMESIDSNWIQSSRTISGLFGLSINLIDNPSTIRPRMSIATNSNESDHLRYASLPNEIICTENLTPWFKLLPCVKYRGLGELFRNPYKLIDSRYLSTSLEFARTCSNPPMCNKHELQLKQTLSIVYNLEALSNKGFNSKDGLISSFSLLFDQKLKSACPLANQSLLFVDLANTGIIDQNADEKIYLKQLDKTVHLYNLKKMFADEKIKEFNPMIVYKKESFVIHAPVTIHRYITNQNERNFGIKSLIRNHNKQEKFKLVVLETIPWYFRVFISSLVIKKNDETLVKPESIHFVPGLNYKRAHHIEIMFDMEPDSVYTIYFNAEYFYLKWDEFPPDVNHGFYINPAMLTIRHMPSSSMNYGHLWPQIRQFELHSTMHERFRQSQVSSSRTYTIYSEALLVNLPAPDFSMPYNVICLTCTVVAIAFGSIHNFTTRKFKFLETRSPIEKLKNFLKSFIKK